MAEARRVAAELVIVDTALHRDHESEEEQERVLDDGTRHSVYKRFFTPQALVAELGGGAPIFAGTYFVAVRVDLR